MVVIILLVISNTSIVVIIIIIIKNEETQMCQGQNMVYMCHPFHNGNPIHTWHIPLKNKTTIDQELGTQSNSWPLAALQEKLNPAPLRQHSSQSNGAKTCQNQITSKHRLSVEPTTLMRFVRLKTSDINNSSSRRNNGALNRSHGSAIVQWFTYEWCSIAMLAYCRGKT